MIVILHHKNNVSCQATNQRDFGRNKSVDGYVNIPDNVDLDPELVLFFLYHLPTKKAEHNQGNR